MNRKNLAPANEVAFTKLQSELQSTVALLHLPQEKRPLKMTAQEFFCKLVEHLN